MGEPETEEHINACVSAIGEYQALFADLGMYIPPPEDVRRVAASEACAPSLRSVDDKTKLSAIYMHDSFANLIVPGDKENIALATRIFDDFADCHFFIAYNGRSPSKVKRHLHTIWNLLSEARHLDESADSKAGTLLKLRKVCYEHCKHRVEKYRDEANRLNLDRFFDEVLRENSPYVVDEARKNGKKPVIYYDEPEYIKSFRSIHQAVAESLRTRDFAALATLMKNILETLDEGRLLAPDYSFDLRSSYSFFRRCGFIG
jgi:hypothetical protein